MPDDPQPGSDHMLELMGSDIHGAAAPEPDDTRAALEQSFNAATGGDPGEQPPAPEGVADGQPQQQEQSPIEPPALWNSQEQEQFRGLPREAQQILADRYRSMEAAHTQRSQEIAPYRQMLDRHSPMLQGLGIDPINATDMAMQYLVPLLRGSNEQRIGVLQQIARDLGIDFGAGAPPKPDPQTDPFGVQQQVHQQLQAGLAPVMQQLNALGQQTNGWQQQQQQQQLAQANAALESFRTEKDADGNLKHPYYDEVQQQMYSLGRARRMETGMPLSPSDIAQIYEQACYMSPSVRSQAPRIRERPEQQGWQGPDRAGKAAARARGGGRSGGEGRQRSARPTEGSEAGAVGGVGRRRYRRVGQTL